MSTFMLGRRDFLKAAAAGGFVLTPVAQAVSAAIDNQVVCLRDQLRATLPGALHYQKRASDSH